MADFVVKFTEPSSFSFKFGAKSVFLTKFGNLGANFDLKFSGSPISENYKGQYIVVPRVDEQTLATAQKFLQRDVTIKKIPYYEVSNSAGGGTVYIASSLGSDESAELGKAILGEMRL